MEEVAEKQGSCWRAYGGCAWGGFGAENPKAQCSS